MQLSTSLTRVNALQCTTQEQDSKLNSLSAENTTLKNENATHLQRIEDLETLRKKMHNDIQDLKGNIRVFCRVRPTIPSELNKPICNVIVADDCTLNLKKCTEKQDNKRLENARTEFTFDHVFGTNVTQEHVFQEVSQLVQSALDGYNVCIFAYGQTGSGKTYTMQGTSGDNIGIIPRTINLIFEQIPAMAAMGWNFKISATFLEVYNERIRDLLIPNDKSDHDIRICESNSKDVYATNTKTVKAKCAGDLMRYIELAQKNRATAVTDYNEHSSRSHSVTKIALEAFNERTLEQVFSSINLVDLAGSEKANIENANRLAETKNINKSLATLSSVMLARLQKNDHVPYRNSKLTYLLMPCLGGNSKTLMLVNVSSLEECWAESIHSLRFASNVKEVKMAPMKKNRVGLNGSNSAI